MVSKIKTHTFRTGKYIVERVNRIDGITDTPDPKGHVDRYICAVTCGGVRELDNWLHEALHAEGIPDKYLHKKDGTSDTERIARFLWRLGYRVK